MRLCTINYYIGMYWFVRYKLAAVVSRDIGVQTHSNVGDGETDHRNTGRSDDGNPHTSGQAELARLQREKQVRKYGMTLVRL